MFKTFIKGGIKIVLLASITLMCLYYFSNVLRPKRELLPNNTYDKVSGFYALDNNSLDVLFLGTSHVYYGFNPGVIYNETGLNTYTFGGECQPIEITYTYLKEALKSQSLSLVVLDLFGLSSTSEGCRSEGIYRINIEELNASKDKFEAYDLLEDQNKIENIFDVSLYHDLWTTSNLLDTSKLVRDDFDDYFGYTLGIPNYEPTWQREYYYTDNRVKPEEKQWEYFNKIVDLCDEQNIPLLLVKTPCYIEEEDAAVYEYIFDWAEENGIPYIDYNKKFIELGYVFDDDGDIWHANARGSLIISKDISDYIERNYRISPTNSSLYREKYLSLYDQSYSIIFMRCYDYNKMLAYLNNDCFTLLISYSNTTGIHISEEKQESLSMFGITEAIKPTDVFINVVSGDRVISTDKYNDYATKDLVIAGKQYQLDTNGYLKYNDKYISYPTCDLNITVIDNRTGYVIDSFGLDTANDLYINRK